jgi:hypothetical protein
MQSIVMLIVTYKQALYADCHYAECHYADCHAALDSAYLLYLMPKL